jgi:hypothetical protein
MNDIYNLLRIDEAMQGHKVFLHCAANQRATAFLRPYRVLRRHRSEVQSFDAMRTIREPDAVWSAFIARALAQRNHSP